VERATCRHLAADTRVRTVVSDCTRYRWAAVAARRCVDRRRVARRRPETLSSRWSQRRGRPTAGCPRRRLLTATSWRRPASSSSAAAAACRWATSRGTGTRYRGERLWCRRSRGGSGATPRRPPTDDTIAARRDCPFDPPRSNFLSVYHRPTALLVQLEQSAKCMFVYPDNNSSTKWPLTYIFGGVVHLDHARKSRSQVKVHDYG